MRVSFILILLVGVFPLHSQTSLGTIVGNVLDESGAAVAGVTVSVLNENTQIKRVVTTSEAGVYTVPSLPPSRYTVSAELRGFRTAVQTNLVLEVNQTLRADMTLKVGDVAERVEVAATLQQLQTDAATVAHTVDNKTVVELPLNGRSFTQLTLLVPGATPGGANTSFQTSGTAVSVSGLRSEANNYTLDGVNNNESFFKTYGLQPSIDAIQEFKVQTNITSAEFGTAAGANVNIVTKSGTNEYHGTAFWFHRNDHLNTLNYFAEQARQSKPKFRFNQFGGVFGGPVKRNSTFFFVMYDATRSSRQATSLSRVPTAAQLAGDLARDEFGAAAPAIYDPFTQTTVNNQRVRQPFANSAVPASRLHPAMVEYAKRILPAPNLQAANANFINTRNNTLEGDQWMVRIDQKLGANNNLTGRFNLNDTTNLRPTALTTIDNTLINTFTNAMVSDTHTFNATTVFDIRAGYHRNNLQVRDSPPGGPEGPISFINTYRLQGIPAFKNANVPLYPQVAVAGFWSVPQGGFPFPDDTYSLMGSLSKTAGKHFVKAGFDFRHNRNLDDGFFTTNINYTKDAVVDPQNVQGTGQAMAAYLLGLPNSMLRNIGDTTALMRKYDYSFYVQDDYKVTQRLTLNLGLRYDLIQWPVHRDNKLGSFDLTTGKFIWDGVNPITGEGPNARRGIVEPDKNNFAPRFGFAYRMGDKNTIRGGYGLFYMSNYLWEAQGVRGNWPFAISETLSNLNVQAPVNPVDRTFSPDLFVQRGSTVAPSAQHIVNRFNRTSYTQQWNLHVQRQLTDDLIFELGYVGNKGTKLSNFMNANTALPGPGAVDPRRPFPILGATSQMTNDVSSSYNGLQVKLDKRFAKGLSFRTNYAWGKTMDVGGAGFGASSTPQNPLNTRGDRALSDLHRAHIFSGDYIWQLPFGKGMRFGGNWNRGVDAVLGGWQVTGIVTMRTGSPINVGVPRDIANIGARSITQRPNVIGDAYSGARTAPDRWIERSAFAEPAAFTFGNLGRNTYIGPGFAQFDFGGYKNFRLTERVGLQFRSEVFNIFNRANFGNPNANFDAGPANFGRITGLAGLPLEAQLGLKMMF